MEKDHETFLVDQLLATYETNDVHVCLIREAEAYIQWVEGGSVGLRRGSVGLRRRVSPQRGILLTLFGEGFSLLNTNNEIVIATLEKTFPLFRHQTPDHAKTVRNIHLVLGNQSKYLEDLGARDRSTIKAFRLLQELTSLQSPLW